VCPGAPCRKFLNPEFYLRVRLIRIGNIEILTHDVVANLSIIAARLSKLAVGLRTLRLLLLLLREYGDYTILEESLRFYACPAALERS
jgi:hypothetical protein